MKKIGILTFQRAHNYGAVLQAYALSTYLKKFNLDVEIVDYWPDYRKGMYDLFDVNFKQKSLTKNLKEIIKTIIGFRKKYIRYNKFKKFISNELGLKNKKSFNKGNQISSSYDYLFFGSDQIWRYNEFLSYKGLDPVYWGEYPSGNKVKKIAYAASMGILNPELLDKNKISKYLANFNSLAVREEVLKNYVKPLTNTSVEHVLDPVFLINPKEWRTLANKSGYKKEFRKKYLLLYNLNTSEKTYSIVNKIAKEKNLEIYEL